MNLRGFCDASQGHGVEKIVANELLRYLYPWRDGTMRSPAGAGGLDQKLKHQGFDLQGHQVVVAAQLTDESARDSPTVERAQFQWLLSNAACLIGPRPNRLAYPHHQGATTRRLSFALRGIG